MASVLQRVRHLLARFEHGGEDVDVLKDDDGSVPAVVRRDEAQHPALLGGREAALLVARR